MSAAGAYALAAVVSLRAREAELAGAALAEALSAEALARSDRERLVVRAASHAADLAAEGWALAASAGPCAGATLRSRAHRLALLRRDADDLARAIAVADEAVSAAAREVDARAARLAQARAALRALERHRDRWRAARACARERAAEEEGEAIVSARRAER